MNKQPTQYNHHRKDLRDIGIPLFLHYLQRIYQTTLNDNRLSVTTQRSDSLAAGKWIVSQLQIASGCRISTS